MLQIKRCPFSIRPIRFYKYDMQLVRFALIQSFPIFRPFHSYSPLLTLVISLYISPTLISFPYALMGKLVVAGYITIIWGASTAKKSPSSVLQNTAITGRQRGVTTVSRSLISTSPTPLSSLSLNSKPSLRRSLLPPKPNIRAEPCRNWQPITSDSSNKPFHPGSNRHRLWSAIASRIPYCGSRDCWPPINASEGNNIEN